MGARGPKSVASLSIVTAELPKIGDASLKPPRPLRAHGKAMWTRIVASYDFSGSPAAAEILAQCCDALDLRGGDQGFYACHVWTAPGWQVKTSRRSIGRCSHVFGLLMRFT
jgi:hypothetical protein